VFGGLVAGALLACGPVLVAGEPGDGLVASAEEVSPVLVGTPVPDGTVRTADGKEATLGSLRAGRPAVLVFYRGHW